MGRLDISKRMKSYESDDRFQHGPVIIRVDGKAFHTWTKVNNCEKPFDEQLMLSMYNSMLNVAKEMQGFKLGYTQSDECTFMLSSDEHSQPWFGNKVQKLVSVTASLFTYYFNQHYKDSNSPAVFDARAYSVPEEDWPNVFVWRQKDWHRNSVSMLANSLYSHKALEKKNVDEQKAMCLNAGVDWEKLSCLKKHGMFLFYNQDTSQYEGKPYNYDYYSLREKVN